MPTSLLYIIGGYPNPQAFCKSHPSPQVSIFKVDILVRLDGMLTSILSYPIPYRALFLPAMLYFVANVTAIHALSHVRSYIFAAIMNSRIVFAALLSVALLNKSLSAEQWRALVMIFCAATVLCLEDVKVIRYGIMSKYESFFAHITII